MCHQAEEDKASNRGHHELPPQSSFQVWVCRKRIRLTPMLQCPVVCTLCPHRERETNAKAAVWRYNMKQHLNITHPEYAHPGKLLGLPLPTEMAHIVIITIQEEKKLGIPVCASHNGPSNASNHRSTHPPATTSSRKKRQADAGQFKLVITSSNGSKHARIVRN